MKSILTVLLMLLSMFSSFFLFSTCAASGKESGPDKPTSCEEAVKGWLADHDRDKADTFEDVQFAKILSFEDGNKIHSVILYAPFSKFTNITPAPGFKMISLDKIKCSLGENIYTDLLFVTVEKKIVTDPI